MRTTGVRNVPSPTPRIHPSPHNAPKPLPRTKFLLKSVSEESPTIPQSPPSATLRSAPPPPARSQSLPANPVPPPKPPRTPSIKEDQSTRPRHPATSNAHARPNRPPPPQCHVPVTGASAFSPPSIRPSTSTPTRPNPSRLLMSPGKVVKTSSVCSVDDFEDACKEVFRNTRRGKELSSLGKYVQAVSHFQVALTALDQVLHAQVLSLSQHEPTIQRLFLQQQEVFSLRKEALNGFTDAQTAIRTPRGLSPTNPTPGAPPSYDDVLQEDNRHLRDDSGPRASTWNTSKQSTRTHQAPTSTRSPRTGPQPHPSSLSTHPTRVRSNSNTETYGEVMDARSGTAGLDMIRSQDPVRPRPRTPARPKSYHHSNKPPASSATPAFLPPPLLPTHSTTLKRVLDEGVLNQMRVLQVHESNDGSGGTSDSHTHSRTKDIHSSPDTDNTHIKKETGNGGKSGLESGKGVSERISEKVGIEGSNASSGPSQMHDPFLNTDPFPLTNQQSRCNDGMFPKEIQDNDDLDLQPSSPNISQAFTDNFNPETSMLNDSSLNHNISKAFTDDFNPETLMLNDSSLGPNQSDSLSPDRLGDSILEALDFATTPGHRRVSAQLSKQRGTARFYSEENLLDVSRNTLEAILHSTGNRQGGGQASIIEEFDPLLASHTQEEGCQEEREICGDKQTPEPALRDHFNNSLHKNTPPPPTTTTATRDTETSPPDYYAEGAVALGEYVDEGTPAVVNQYTSLTYPNGVQGGASRTRLPPSEDYSATYSLPPEYSSMTSPESDSPFYPCLQEQEEEEESEEREPSMDVGRSAFYIPPTPQRNVKRKNLLSIREGVKIYFIYKDNVVTSPWNKPVLTVYRDPSKDQLFSSGLVLSVGNSVWVCELHKKATMVLRTHTGTGYIFNDVSGKQNRKAVAIRVPSAVKRAQQELLSGILQQHTMMEEERPKGITKAISKGASSAASRMNRLVEDESMTSEQTFMRRNSMRALKGVSKRLTSIAARTGATLSELPEEYQGLQEAADSLVFALNAKMIQYI